MIEHYLEIENLIPKTFANEIENIFSSDFFPWYYNTSTVAENFNYSNTNVVESDQFTHTIKADDNRQPSFALQEVKPILYFLEEKTNIEIKNIERIKANLLQPIQISTSVTHNPPHWDADYRIQPNTLSMVYYINDCDGDTFIFNERLPEDPSDYTLLGRSTPKKGKCVIFPSNRWHASSNPTVHKRRMIINFVLTI